MFRKILAFLPLAGIVTACSSGGVGTGGVGDTWNPEAEIQKANAQADKCRILKENPTHKNAEYDADYFHLDGNTFIDVLNCPRSFQIGKTYVDDGRDFPSRAGIKTKFIMRGSDVIEYEQHTNGETLEVRVYKSIK